MGSSIESQKPNKSALPDLPPEEWCDFRIAYEETHSLRRVAEQFCCDPRTVRNCLRLNKSSAKLGSQTAPRILDPYYETIRRLYNELCAEAVAHNSVIPGSCQISRIITAKLAALGYSGSERTVRNYIRQHCLPTVRKESSHDQD